VQKFLLQIVPMRLIIRAFFSFIFSLLALLIIYRISGGQPPNKILIGVLTVPEKYDKRSLIRNRDNFTLVNRRSFIRTF
jgi:hypothetical protein